MLCALQDVGDTTGVSKPTPASIGPKELLDVKVPAPKGEKPGALGEGGEGASVTFWH